MAHFAQIDENGVVLQVLVVNNDDILDENGNESEEIGKSLCQSLFGGSWVQTSYNANFRKNYASVGSVYNSEKDVFIPEKPKGDWVLNEETYQWEPNDSIS